MKLFVGNRVFRTSKKDMQQLFSKASTVEVATSVEDSDVGYWRGARYVRANINDVGENERVKYYLKEITESRKRARKTQTEINRLKKKTQAILNKLR